MIAARAKLHAGTAKGTRYSRKRCRNTAFRRRTWDATDRVVIGFAVRLLLSLSACVDDSAASAGVLEEVVENRRRGHGVAVADDDGFPAGAG